MTANARINPDTFYVDGTVLPAGYWITLDTRQYKALWWDKGGTWSPSSTIQLGGAGLWSIGPSVISFTQTPGAYTPVSSGLRFTHGGNDYLTFSSAVGTHTIEVSCGQTAVDRSFGYNIGAGANVPRMFYESTKDGRKNYQSNGAYSIGGVTGRLVMPLSVHNGATLASVTLAFNVGQNHGSVPASLPQMRVVKVDGQGKVTPLLSNTAAAGWQGAGFVAINPTPGSWNTGAQSIVYTCDAGVVIDTTKCRYFVQIIDECGSSAMSGNEFLSVVASYTTIADYRPQ